MKNPVLFTLLAIAVVILGCTGQTAKNGDSVSVTYSVSHEDGTLIDNNNMQPLNFTIGNGEVIKGFNYAVIGMTVGETKKVTVTPAEGYGPYDDSKITIDSVANLEKSGINATNGSVVYAAMGQNRERGVIIDTNGTHVLIDFNPPLAGKTLLFEIKLVGILNHAGNAIKG